MADLSSREGIEPARAEDRDGGADHRRGQPRVRFGIADLADRALAILVESFLAFIPAVVVAFVLGSQLDLGLGEVHYVLFGGAVALTVAVTRAVIGGRSSRRR